MQATEALSHPLVVWAAWLRVNEWYRSGNLAPQPELCQWRLHPEAAVRKLADELRSGEWHPDAWPQLPYPKRGACLRHYVMPTVKDQVAFMAYLVLLGPLVDDQFFPFVFGNRLYRPLAWNTRDGNRQWEPSTYPLLNHRTYLPYARSHGLFRRVASWTVSRITNAALPEENYAGRVHRPRDYDNSSLPPWTQEAWWQDRSGVSGDRAYWASLDIQLAYPSVRLQDLLDALLRLARTPSIVEASLSERLKMAFLHHVLDGYPHVLLDGLNRRPLREDIAKSLVDALESVRVRPSEIPTDAWRPHHARAELPPENRGLPTGLAISGLLLNVVLHRADELVYEYLAETTGNGRGAIVRFADDMYLLSRSAEGLFQLIDVVWGAVEATTGNRPITPESKSNLHINLSKVGPGPAHDAVRGCLLANGWKVCKHKECDEVAPSKGAQPASLARWWQDNPNVPDDIVQGIERISIGPGEMGPFVTTLVERLSAIGNDTLGDRFGQAARDRQIQLHDLARFDIADEQVRAETRRTFAANRLASVWLSRDRGQARHELAEVRRSVAQVFKETPWKFSLWGAIVRTAARRVIDARDHQEQDDNEARQWLSCLLVCVSQVAEDSWLEDWPEESRKLPHRESREWQCHYLSFHRAVFWRELASTVRRLYAYEERREDSRQATNLSPRNWATRAVPEGLHEHVARFLSQVDVWTELLYGESPVAHLPRLELDQIATACLAALPRRTVAEAWRSLSARGIRRVIVPDRALEGAPVTYALLNAHKHIASVKRKKPLDALSHYVVAQLLLSSRNDRLENVLFPKGEKPRLREVEHDPVYGLAVARQFNCIERVRDDIVLDAFADAKSRLLKDSLALNEYGYARRVLLGREGLEWR